MASERRRPRLRRSDFDRPEDFARALSAAGPEFEDLDALLRQSGEHAEVARAVFGENMEEFGQACERELAAEARARPHVFVRKLTRVRAPK